MKKTRAIALALALSSCVLAPMRSVAELAPPRTAEMNRDFLSTTKNPTPEKSNAFIDKYGAMAFYGMNMCMQAYALNGGNKTSALTDNYEHKLEWMQFFRNMSQKENERNPGGDKLEGQEQRLVDAVIIVAKSYCPNFK